MFSGLMTQQFLKFILIGIINTLFGYGVFALFLYFGMSYITALFLATCCGILFNFKSIGIYVFQNKKNNLLLKFILLYLAIYIVNLILMRSFNYFIHNMYLSGIITLIATAGLSFICNKKYVFANYDEVRCNRLGESKP